MAPTVTADPTTVSVNETPFYRPDLSPNDPARTDMVPSQAPEAAGIPGGSPTPTPGASAEAGAGGGENLDAYNPLSAQPYTPPEATPVTPLPQSQLGPDQPPNGAVSHAGGVAYGLDQVLRGFMRGRAQNQAAQAINLAKTSSGLQKNLDMASQQYYALAKAGTDPNSQQMQDAKSQVDAAWQANMDFMKQHIAGEQIDKKTGQLKPQQGSVMQRLVNGADPAAQAIAVYQGAQRLGPPVYHQAAPFQTPAYQAYARTQALTGQQQAQGGLATAQLANVKAQQEQDYNTLLSKTDRSPQEDQKLAALGQALDKPGSLTQRVQDEMAQQIEYQVRSGTMSQEEGVKQLAILKSHSAAGMMLKQPQAGTKGFMQQKYAESIYGPGASPAQLNAAQLSYIDQVDSWNKIHNVTTSSQHLVPGEDKFGRPGMIPMTTISTRGVPGAPQPPAGSPPIDSIGPIPTEQAAAAATNPVVPPNASPAAMTAAASAHSNALSNGSSPKTALAVARATAKRVQNSNPDAPPGFMPTGKQHQQTPDETKAYNDEGTIGKALTDAERAAQLPDKAAGDAALSSAFARSQVQGRLTNFDIQRFSNLGSAKMRMEGNLTKSIDGTMTDAQRQMLIDNMRVNYSTAHNYAENYRNRTPGTGQRPSAAGASPAAGKAPSADDLEELFQKAKGK